MCVGSSLDFSVGDFGQTQFTEHTLQSAGSLVTGSNDSFFADRLQTAVDLHVALDDVPVIIVVSIPVGTSEHIVVVGSCGVAGADVVSAGEQLRHGTSNTAQIGVGEGLVVGGGGLQVQQHSDQVLSSDGADTTGNTSGNTNTGDGTVLGTLNAGALGNCQAAGFQVQHGLAFSIAHLDFGTGTGSETHLQAAGCIAGCQECLGVGGVVAVHEDGLSAVDGDGLGVSGKAAHTQLQLGCFFQCTLGHDTSAASLGTDEQSHCIEGSVTGDTNSGFHFSEATDSSFSSVSSDLDGVILNVGDVALVGGHQTSTHLGHAHHDFNDGQLADDFGQLSGSQAQGDSQDLVTGNVDVNDLASDFQRVNSHGLLSAVQTDSVVSDKGVQHVELVTGLAVHFNDAAILNLDAGGGVEGAVHSDQTDFCPFLYVAVLIDRTGGQDFKTFRLHATSLLPEFLN